jgi:hypothetical protein
MWKEYHSDDPEYNDFVDSIDGFDNKHSIWVHLDKNEQDYVMVYHNEFESEGSPYYYGIYTSDGDGECCGNLDSAKEIALEIMPE